jgi:hypothetical protein
VAGGGGPPGQVVRAVDQMARIARVALRLLEPFERTGVDRLQDRVVLGRAQGEANELGLERDVGCGRPA